MINSNGLRFAHDPQFLEAVARFRHRIEVYLQFDGFSNPGSELLRGEPLVETKLRAVEALGRHGIRVILVTTLHPGVNDHDIGAIVKYGLERRFVTGISFQPATYSGRHVLPADLERRITFPDVVRAVAEQTDGLFREDDFLPLPCAHPNCHSLTYAYRANGHVVPLSRFIDARKHLDILANGITFTRPRARQLIEQYLGRLGCCGGNCESDSPAATAESISQVAGLLPLLLGNAETSGANGNASIGGGRRLFPPGLGRGSVARGRVPHHHHLVPGRVQFRRAPVDEVLHPPRAAQRACHSVLRVQCAVSRGPCPLADLAGHGGRDAADNVGTGGTIVTRWRTV